MILEKKVCRLKKIISGMDSILVAFSAGTDSTFLLKVASALLPPEKIIAVTASSATYPREELLSSRDIARTLGVRHVVINTLELEDRRFTENTIERCYFCKRELFKKLKDMAKRFKLEFVIDATNASDKDDFRPGKKARKEFNVRSPLEEAGLSKKDIRLLSRKMGLSTWDKPAMACLASRIPYGRKIIPGILAKINKGEQFLKQLGFGQVRLRHYQDLCRIEVIKEDIPKLIKQQDLIVEKLKRLGYNYITVDLEGYRTGSLNEAITK